VSAFGLSTGTFTGISGMSILGTKLLKVDFELLLKNILVGQRTIKIEVSMAVPKDPWM
jgi:hypothetical protein